MRGLGCVWLTLLAFGGPAVAQVSAVPSPLMACRGIADVAARAACYDRFVDANTPRANTFAPSVPPITAPAAPAPQPEAAPRIVQPTAPVASTATLPASRFGADDLPPERRNPGVAPPPAQIIAKVTQVRTDESDYVVVTLDSGQTWRQTDGPTLRVLPGASVKIRQGLIGSYLMSLADGNRSVRVKRIN
jgi:hypothetical protein